METVVLSTVTGLQKDKESVHSFLCATVDSMISKASTQWKLANPGEPEQNCPLPLIRLRVDYSDGFNTPAPTAFGKSYIGLVANPREMLLYHRKRAIQSILDLIEKQVTTISKAKVEDFLYDGGNDEGVVEAMIAFHLRDKELSILPDNELTDVVNSVVTRQTKDELEAYVLDVVKDTRAQIDLTADLEDDKKMETAISESKTRRKENYTETHGESKLQSTKTQFVRDFSKNGSKKVVLDQEEDFDEGFDTKVMYIVNNNAPKGPSKARKASDREIVSDIDSFSDNESSVSSKRPRLGAPKKGSVQPTLKSLGGSSRAATTRRKNPFK